nr:glycogen debranching protein GlgX [uncultured Moellerella sp.]
MPIEWGRAFPMGSHFDGKGVNFSLFSENAQKVILCVFDQDGEETRYPLLGKTGSIWHGYLMGAMPGLCYGYRLEGEWAPEKGHFYNPLQLVLDPYAKQLTSLAQSNIPLKQAVEVPITQDNGQQIPKAIVVENQAIKSVNQQPKDSRFPLRTPWSKTIIYEGHVKGLTQLHPDIPADIAGSYAALGHPIFIEHLQKLGITALELLPVQSYLTEPHLAQLGLTNYWGYNVLAPFALSSQYLSKSGSNVRDEFCQSIRQLHDAGIEVILDVVFNHTAELGDRGNGYVLSLRGIDNRSYYWLDEDNRAQNWTGCGNTLNINRPETVQWVMDCLRYWVDEYHIDGFRFDLGSSLARVPNFDALSPLLTAMRQDPVIAQVKLIVEPWDLGVDGYQLGGFPVPFAEWNDRFRDDIRRFWLWHDLSMAALADSLTGTNKRFDSTKRPPYSSINMVTSHDGFTLRDLVSYNQKHNEENGERNYDGHDGNYSSNHGEEGLIVSDKTVQLRLVSIRNLLATLMLSRGTPHLLAGDELGNSQYGNNNAYCQDTKVSWLKWLNAPYDLTDYIAELIKLRHKIISLYSKSRWKKSNESLIWLDQNANSMSSEMWQQVPASPLQVFLAEQWLLVINPLRTPAKITLPQGVWCCLLDTASWPQVYPIQSDHYEINANSITLWQSADLHSQPSNEGISTLLFPGKGSGRSTL